MTNQYADNNPVISLFKGLMQLMGFSNAQASPVSTTPPLELPTVQIYEFESASRISNLQFYALLKHRDWFAGFSDDWSVIKQGEEEWDILVKLSNAAPELQEMRVAYKDSVFSGPAWSTEKKSPPPIPETEVFYEIAPV